MRFFRRHAGPNFLEILQDSCGKSPSHDDEIPHSSTISTYDIGSCNLVRKEVQNYQERAEHLINSGCQSTIIMNRLIARIDGLRDKKRKFEDLFQQELDDEIFRSQCIDNARTLRYTFIYKEAIAMAKTANLNIRIDPEIKSGAENLFASFGITITDAINIFLHQSLMEGGLPFEVRQPRYNAETEAAVQEARQIIAGQSPAKRYSSAKELFEELDAELEGGSC